MQLGNFKKHLYGGIGISLFLLSSCVNQDYDLSKGVNMDITIGAGGISLPFGNTEPIRLAELIKESDIIKLENGQYSIRKSGSIEETRINIDPVNIWMKIPDIDPVVVDFNSRTVTDFTIGDFQNTTLLGVPEVSVQNISFDPIRQEKTISGGSFPNVPTFLPEFILKLPETTMKCVFEFDLPDEIKEVKKVYLGSERGQRVSFQLDMSTIINAMNSAGFKQSIPLFRLSFPENFELASDPDSPFYPYMQTRGNEILFQNVPLSGDQRQTTLSFYVKSVTLNASASTTCHFEDQIRYEVHYQLTGTTTGQAATPELGVVFDEQFLFYDADIVTNAIHFDLSPSDVKIEAEITGLEDIRRVEEVTFEDSYITLHVSDPLIPLTLHPNGKIQIRLSDLFEYRIHRAPIGVVLNNGILSIPADVLFGCKIELELTRANLSGHPIVNNRIAIAESISYHGENLVLQESGVQVGKLESFNQKEIKFSVKGSVLHVADAQVVTSMVETTVETETVLNINEKVPEELQTLHAVSVEQGSRPQLRLRLNFPADFPSGVERLSLEDFKIYFPEFIRFNDSRVKNNILTLNESFRPKAGYMTDLVIEGMDFLSFNGGKGIHTYRENGETRIRIDSQNQIRVRGKVKADDAKVSADDLKRIQIQPVVTVDEMTLGIVKGYVDPVIDPIQESLSFELGEDLDFLRQDAVLNLHNPQIHLKVGNTMGVPVDIKLNLSARDANGQLIPDSEVVPISLTLAPAEQNGIVSYSNFLISKQGTELAGYQSVQSSDLSNLMTVLPEAISIQMEAVANQDTPHEIDLGREIERSISADYEVVIPLRFEAIDLNYVETIDGLKKDLEDFSANQEEITIELRTNVFNTIPLDLDLTVAGYDVDKQKLEGITSEKCPIKAGSGENEAVQTEVLLKITVAKGVLPELESLDLVIHGNAEETINGVELREDQFVQLKDIRLKVLGGVNVNIDNL